LAVDGVCGGGVGDDAAAAEEPGAGAVWGLVRGFDEVSGSLLFADWAGWDAASAAEAGSDDAGLFGGGRGGDAVRGGECAGGGPRSWRDETAS